MRYSGGPVARKKVSVTIDQYLCGKQKEASDLLLSPNNGIQNVVASLHGVPASERWPAKPAAVQMDQRKCEFIPRVVIVPPGKYTLQLWHETLGTVTQEVTVSGDSTNVTVHM